MILASMHPSFSWLLWSLFTQFHLESPRSHIVAVSAESKLHSRNCRSYWNLEVYARVPSLESDYVLIYKLHAMYFVTGNFWRGLHCERWKLCRAHFCEVLPKQNQNLFDGQNGIWQAFKTQCWTLPRATSHTRLKAHVHHILRSPIGRKGQDHLYTLHTRMKAHDHCILRSFIGQKGRDLLHSLHTRMKAWRSNYHAWTVDMDLYMEDCKQYFMVNATSRGRSDANSDKPFQSQGP